MCDMPLWHCQMVNILRFKFNYKLRGVITNMSNVFVFDFINITCIYIYSIYTLKRLVGTIMKIQKIILKLILYTQVFFQMILFTMRNWCD